MEVYWPQTLSNIPIGCLERLIGSSLDHRPVEVDDLVIEPCYFEAAEGRRLDFDIVEFDLECRIRIVRGDLINSVSLWDPWSQGLVPTVCSRSVLIFVGAEGRSRFVIFSSSSKICALNLETISSTEDTLIMPSADLACVPNRSRQRTVVALPRSVPVWRCVVVCAGRKVSGDAISDTLPVQRPWQQTVGADLVTSSAVLTDWRKCPYNDLLSRSVFALAESASRGTKLALSPC